MSILSIPIKRLDAQFDDIPLPHYATPGSAGMDIRAAVSEPLTLQAGAVTMIPTSIAIALPPGFEAQVRSRSGLAAKHGIFALNAPGTIDSDYRGEIKVILANFGQEDFVIERGERIAQVVIARYEHIEWQNSDDLPESERGAGGFGSTGTA